MRLVLLFLIGLVTNVVSRGIVNQTEPNYSPSGQQSHYVDLVGGCDIVFLVETAEIEGGHDYYDAFGMVRKIAVNLENVNMDNNRLALGHYSSHDSRTAASILLTQTSSFTQFSAAIDRAQEQYLSYLGVSDMDYGLQLAQHPLFTTGQRAANPDVFVLLSSGFVDPQNFVDPVPRGQQLQATTSAFYTVQLGQCPNNSPSCTNRLNQFSDRVYTNASITQLADNINRICPVTQITSTMGPTTTPAPLPRGNCDIIFALDASQSQAANFNMLTAFVTDVVVMYKDLITSGHVRIGWTAFTDQVYVAVPPGTYVTTDAIVQALTNLQLSSIAGLTNIAAGLVSASDLLGHPTGNKVIVLLSDGEFDIGLDPGDVSSALRAQGIAIFAVGVPGDTGPVQTPSQASLIAITGSERNCVFERDLNNLPK